jgi:hypothetical protein
MKIQERLFELIKGKIPSSQRLADVVGEVLNVGSDSAYRRIRGQKKLDVDELAVLCKYFDISLDAMINYCADNVSFKYTPLDLGDFNNFYSYKNGLARTFESIADANDNDILIMALDVSVFHITPFKELSFFKDYTWFQSVAVGKISYEQFVKGLDVEQVLGYFDRITAAYLQIPTTEIWTYDTLNPILNLLEYYTAIDCFENKYETVPILLRQLLQVVEKVEENAERGWKEHNGKTVPCLMYLSPLNIMNDVMIARRNGVKTGIIKLHTINGLFTDNDFFCSEMEQWITDFRSKSLSLTDASARERYRFFRHLKDRINEVAERLGVDY